MKLTGICHFYNEEYLLPYWLEHHINVFDELIMIDYHSTDRSRQIIRAADPKDIVVTSKNTMFSAKDCDAEVLEYEKTVDGYKIALNVTEFLVGDVKKLLQTNLDQYGIPVYPMIDTLETEFTELTPFHLVRQRFHGIDFQKSQELFNIRKARSLHRIDVQYPTGRHMMGYNTMDCVICWYGYSPFNESTIKRKLQIQNKIPDDDKKNLFGREHIIDRNGLIGNLRHYQQFTEDLSDRLFPKLEEMGL